MHLRELKLNGFKSFAQPTKLTFDPGLTVIVGPNGCGKSNIADAIRWVLGEQSAKALRGGKMQDVIFEGTDARKAVHLCEVTLVFTGCEPLLGEGFHEVELSRRVSRDGQSDYFINGKACRLKDIQRTFMDTGVGRSSYSIMAQGQIDQILASNPIERRSIFEEAAGITKYKSQRKEALNKLKLTEANLARLNDVLDEVRRQINSLRRQASKALRYKKLRFRLEKLDLAYHGREHARIDAFLSQTNAKVRELDAEANRETSKLKAEEEGVEEKKRERSRLNSDLQEAQQKVFDLRSAAEQAESAIRLAETRKEDASARLADAKREKAAMKEQLDEASKEVAGNARSKEEQYGLVAESDQTFRTHSEAVEATRTELADEENRLTSEKHALLRAESDVTRLRTEASEIEINVKSNDARADSLEREIDSLKEEETEAADNLAALETELEKTHAAHASAQEDLEAAKDRVAAAREAYRAKQAEIQNLDRGIAQNNARLRLLQQLQEKLEGFSEGAKALLQGKLDHALPAETTYCPVTRNIRVKPAYTRALETLLGAAIECVAIPTADAAQTVAELLDQEKMGKACLRFPPPGDAPGDSESSLPGCLTPATELFTTESSDEADGPHPLTGLLSRSYYAENAADFFAFWQSRPDFRFLHVVTARGELIDHRGLLYGGFGKGNENSLLHRDAEIREINADIAEDQKQLERLKTEAEKAQADLDAAEKAVEAAHETVREAANKRSTREAEKQNAERNREETVARRTRIESERERLREQHTGDREKLDSVKKQLAEAEQRHGEQKETISACEDRIAEIRKRLEAQTEKLSEARFDLAQKKQRLESLDRGLSEMESRTEQLRNGIAERGREIERIESQILSFDKEREDQRNRVEELNAALEDARARVESIRGEYRSVEEAIDASEKALGEERARRDELDKELGRLRVKLAEQRSHRDHLVEEIHREWEVSLPHVDWREALWRAGDDPGGPHPLDLDDGEEDEKGKPDRKTRTRPPMTEQDREALEAETDWEGIRTEIDAIRSRIHAMGPVNLVAIEEYAELKERHEFLGAQHTDLVSARDQLLQAIDDINERSTTQFRSIFEQIRKNFAYTFEHLFGGGKATLELMEAEDPLEAGIEIVAQPPGTKLKSIVLLSGGQKTMTAVALLFAIYMVKPSPFCVLDELDAPLDEANIGRFTSMLKEFVSESQFLIITHNKRTISEAEAIFGVTMEEKGVSKVVSMRFNRDKQRAEPEQETAVPAFSG